MRKWCSTMDVRLAPASWGERGGGGWGAEQIGGRTKEWEGRVNRWQGEGARVGRGGMGGLGGWLHGWETDG